MTLSEVEAIPVRIVGVEWVDVQHLVIERPDDIQSRRRCLAVLLVTRHHRQDPVQVVVPVANQFFGIGKLISLCHMFTVQLQVTLKSSESETSIKEQLTIGQVSERTGVATSALRFYEDIELISSTRTDGNQRRYDRSVLRSVSVVKAAQEVGLSLKQITEALASLPEGRAPTKRDWANLATRWRVDLDNRIEELIALRDDLADCIGCGCLSLRACALFNPGDRASAAGTGARYIVGDARPPADARHVENPRHGYERA